MQPSILDDAKYDDVEIGDGKQGKFGLFIYLFFDCQLRQRLQAAGKAVPAVQKPVSEGPFRVFGLGLNLLPQPEDPR